MIDKPIEIRELQAGSANQVLYLRGATASYIFKWLRQNRQFGLDRAKEFELQQYLAESGLAPKVIALDPDLWVLQEYVCHPPLTRSRHNPTEKMRLTAQALADIHRQQPAWQGSDIWQKCAYYADQLGQSVRQQLFEFKRALRTDEPPVLCHFDLSFAHILVGSPVTVLDWEYAGWGDRLTDLASTIEINQLTVEQGDLLCYYYTQATGIAIDIARLNQHRLFVRWLNQQWSRLLV